MGENLESQRMLQSGWKSLLENKFNTNLAPFPPCSFSFWMSWNIFTIKCPWQLAAGYSLCCW